MKPEPLGNAFAAATGLVWVLWAIFVWLMPSLSLSVADAWFFGLEGIQVTGWSLDLNIFLVGGVGAVIFAWIFGYLLGWSYQRFKK